MEMSISRKLSCFEIIFAIILHKLEGLELQFIKTYTLSVKFSSHTRYPVIYVERPKLPRKYFRLLETSDHRKRERETDSEG